MKVNVERVHILRQIDGQVIIRDHKQQILSSLPPSTSDNDADENLRQLKLLRLENEQLRSQLTTHQTEINVLRGERDCLMHTISKLDSELTRVEHQCVSQQLSPRKK